MGVLDVLRYSFQAEGYSYRQQFLIAAELIITWIIAALIALTIVQFLMWVMAAKKKRMRWERFYWITIHLTLLGVLSTIPLLMLYGVILDYVNVAISIVFTFVWMAIGWYLICPTSILTPLRIKLCSDLYPDVPKTKRSMWMKPLKRPVWFWTGIAIAFLSAFLLNYFLEDVCLATQPLEISFKVSRRHSETYCPSGKPCHVYLTAGPDLSTTMIVNFHTRQPIDVPIVYYDLKSRDRIKDYRYVAKGKTFQMPIEEERHVSWIELLDLEPGAVYYFRTGGKSEDGEHEWFSEEYWFRTGPKDDEDFTYISGGDMGLRPETKKLERLTKKYDPLFILIGGDIAYDSGMIQCYRRWDEWFRLYESQTSEGKRLIPMLLAIGNHEGGWLTQNKKDFPFYFAYFPQQFGLERKDWLDRDSYRVHTVGSNTMILSLDSGHVHNPKDQIDFIKHYAREYQHYRHKLAAYHVPMFLGAQKNNDGHMRERLRSYWRPLFEK
eukprot:TRINITY_DN10611_c0_g1_i1.p1 TRINITY_DN10611_c0_g1~~TRINITY_DN10611_c0_g1_i1.p1  ORF type:complete len:494 (+),score=81.11 TRINITY_DN10611_c0_g1_i1:262-1743(+)